MLQLPDSVRKVVLEDDAGTKQEVTMRYSYFMSRNQEKDLQFTCSLLSCYFPYQLNHLCWFSVR
jgi:hypothetical protein